MRTSGLATDRTQIIAALAAAFPQREIGPETIGTYVRALADIPVAELEQAAKALTLDSQWFPTVRDLRRTVAETRLQLPAGEAAWAQALEWADTRPTIRCTAGCTNGVLPGGDPVELDRSLVEPIEDDYLRGLLERIVKQAAEPTHLCETCGGAGEIPNTDRLELQQPVRQALEHIGGAAAIATSENLGILRAQFLKAYDHVRDEALRDENLGSAGLMLNSGQRPAIERRST
jgi:hypothetical protein